MRLSEFDFPFDESLIADYPVSPRDHARLLVVLRKGEPAFQHARIKDLPNLLRSDDVVVLNDTKVIPARLHGTKRPTGGKIEALLVRPLEEKHWEVLLKGHVDVGQVLQFQDEATAEVLERSQERTVLRINTRGSVTELLDRIGEVPLPPYIKRPATEQDKGTYQTVFARSEGAVAAPTAGLHFTDRLLVDLKQKGIQLATVTLHVGPGTFRPVTVDRIEDHHMAAEWFDISEETAQRLNAAKAEGRRVVAVGTTSVRTLESAVNQAGHIQAGASETRLFITPGFRFTMVDALLTNFHLPRTTLLMLVSAFGGHEQLHAAYAEAITARYRFYSYGDAMLIQ
ncbi:MAG: tRNA preQ1(34) S-adenosylmethionine ribosyltransferase-isomerase QueA [Nitrospira sp.]|nr:tRNA preQ1(34) S-adenosylmethionine ribosyltransferase-isomerase QueA [Nitrospira sp.]MDE0486795.1 tRNA preQ1(34) S-adenosylmethionine ribosyltransferase-isomerase QueA [Nitrospira sp.]